MTAHSPAASELASADVRVTGRRVLATIIDGILIAIGSAVFMAPVALFGDHAALAATASVLLSLAYFVLVVAYYVLMEGLLGQTIGKMVCGIQVIAEDTGQRPGLAKAAIRTVLRVVDGLFSYLVAFIAVLASEKNQRLGDMAAGTLVVRK
jgi:uncharacterized RDD family membrane protein YckC